MKVETVNVYLVTTGKLHPVVVEIVTDEGIAGIGEAAISARRNRTADAQQQNDDEAHAGHWQHRWSQVGSLQSGAVRRLPTATE